MKIRIGVNVNEDHGCFKRVDLSHPWICNNISNANIY